MISSILLLILASLWILLRPSKKEWFIVEHRVSDDKAFAPTNVPVATTINDYQKAYIDAAGMKITETLAYSVTILNKNGGTLYLKQKVFCDFIVAKLYYEDMIKIYTDPRDNVKSFHLFILRRVVARSRSKAVVLPPNRYDYDAINLIRFPEYYWYNNEPSGFRVESERG